jgi:hypothetical protein
LLRVCWLHQPCYKQDDNNLFQTCQQLGTSSANTSCWDVILQSSEDYKSSIKCAKMVLFKTKPDQFRLLNLLPQFWYSAVEETKRRKYFTVYCLSFVCIILLSPGKQPAHNDSPARWDVYKAVPIQFPLIKLICWFSCQVALSQS